MNDVAEFRKWFTIKFPELNSSRETYNIAQRGRFFRVKEAFITPEGTPSERVSYFYRRSMAFVVWANIAFAEAVFATKGDVPPKPETPSKATYRTHTFDDNVSVSPFMYVTFDFDVEDDYRVIVYGAYNAMGLIGSESNGVAVLDNRAKEIVCDELFRVGSGWGGPTLGVQRDFDALALLLVEDHRAFANVVNTLGAARLRKPVRELA